MPNRVKTDKQDSLILPAESVAAMFHLIAREQINFQSHYSVCKESTVEVGGR
jgi:hypothetical protein